MNEAVYIVNSNWKFTLKKSIFIDQRTRDIRIFSCGFFFLDVT